MHVIPALSDPVELSEALWTPTSSPNSAASVAILSRSADISHLYPLGWPTQKPMTDREVCAL